jgi:hypothetical protein
MDERTHPAAEQPHQRSLPDPADHHVFVKDQGARFCERDGALVVGERNCQRGGDASGYLVVKLNSHRGSNPAGNAGPQQLRRSTELGNRADHLLSRSRMSEGGQADQNKGES